MAEAHGLEAMVMDNSSFREIGGIAVNVFAVTSRTNEAVSSDDII